MRVIRVYTTTPLQVGLEVSLAEEAQRHLQRVLRLQTGATVRLFNGDGCDYVATLEQLDKKMAVAVVKEKVPLDNESSLDMTLYCAMLKGEPMDRVVQKAVELGVNKLVPVITERTEAALKRDRLPNKMSHWHRIIIASSQQCGRARLMAMAEPLPFAQVIKHEYDKRLIFSPHHSWQAAEQRSVATVALLVGPEGGFSADEVTMATANNWSTQSLGRRILRADTAAMAAVVLTQERIDRECFA